MSKFFEESRGLADSGSAAGPARNAVTGKIDELLSSLKTSKRDPEPISDHRSIVTSDQVDLAAVSQAATVSKKTDLSTSERLLGRSDQGDIVIAADAYRMLRTRLLRLLNSRSSRSVVITSAMQGEGKTITTMNLGISCSQLRDTRVLLVDGDLRNTGLTRLLAKPYELGLSDALTGKAEFEECVTKTDVEKLYIVGAGSPTDTPAELIAGSNWKRFMKWATEEFKLVIVDSPPVLALADFELLAAGCDTILAIVRAHTTQREILERCMNHIDRKKLIGAVLNDAKLTRAIQGSYYYYQYGDKNNGHKAQKPS